MPSVIEFYIELTKNPEAYPKKEFKRICKAYGIERIHLQALTHVIYGLLIREGFVKLVMKIRRLIISGSPNTGKTRMFTMLKIHLGDWLFYDMGTRRNDFTGYIPKNKPIILIDDNLGTQGASLAMSSRINIPDFQTIKPTIIKVIRGEEFPGDVKCLEVIIVKAAYAVIISNNPLLFRTYAVDQNLAARGRLIHFPRRGSPR